MTIIFETIRKLRMVTLWLVFISFAHMYPGWFWPNGKTEAKIIKQGMKEAGTVAAGTVAAALVTHSEAIKEAGASADALKDTVKAGSDAIAAGLQANATALVVSTLLVGGGWLAYKAQPHIWPTTAQKAQKERDKKEYAISQSEGVLGKCLMNNKNVQDLNENGIPKMCCQEANDFLMKAGNEKYAEMVARYRNLN